MSLIRIIPSITNLGSSVGNSTSITSWQPKRVNTVMKRINLYISLKFKIVGYGRYYAEDGSPYRFVCPCLRISAKPYRGRIFAIIQIVNTKYPFRPEFFFVVFYWGKGRGNINTMIGGKSFLVPEAVIG